MKYFVKLPVFFTILFLSYNAPYSQIKLNGGSVIADDVKKVIDDYPNHFDNILGELIIQNPQSADYQCNFKVEGAEECIITRYTSKKNIVSSWAALMLTTGNFSEAKKKFKSLYTLLNNLSVKSMHLKGVYEQPVEEKKFSSVLFSFTSLDESLKKLKVELVVEAEGMDWKVKVLVYDRDREDNERGDTRD
jgi:hypothetical protein